MSSNAQKLPVESQLMSQFTIKILGGDYQSDMYNGQKHSMEINDMARCFCIKSLPTMDMATTKNLATNYVIFHDKRPLYLVMQ